MRLPMRSCLAVGAALIAVLLVVPGSSRSDDREKLSLTPQQWREDLHFLARTLPEKHANAFHYTSKDKFEEAVDALDKRLDRLDGDGSWVGMAEIVALVGDAHTYLQTPGDDASFPLTVEKFGNDFRVVGASAELRRTLGARLIKIEDIPVARVAATVYRMFSQDENPELSEAFIAGGLTTGSYLHGLGITSDRSAAHYTLAGDDGEEFNVEVHAQKEGEREDETISVEKDRPLSRLHPGEHYYCTYLAEKKTVYCNIRTMRNLKDPERQILKLVGEKKPDKLAIDLRQNSGGDFHQGLKHLVRPIRDMAAINRSGHLFILIGPNTFSAAMNNAAHFRQQTNAILVGRTIGEKPNEYAEPRAFDLPNSHLTIRYSTKFYRFIDKGENAIRPDKEIVGTWEDYLAGRDPVLDWVLGSSKE